MNRIKINAEQLHCPTCGTIIPAGQSTCQNSNCRTNRPMKNKVLLKKIALV